MGVVVLAWYVRDTEPAGGALEALPAVLTLLIAVPLCVWLDGRKGRQQHFYSAAGRVGSFAPEVLVYPGPEDKGVCPCCDLDVSRAGDGTVFTAFRNSKDGCRDIYVSRSTGGAGSAFEPPVAVSPDHWTLDGCPHDGASATTEA